jgi:hypothetical protein
MLAVVDKNNVWECPRDHAYNEMPGSDPVKISAA